MPFAPIQMLLVGAPGGPFRHAANLAREAGAEVAMADSPDAALARLRASPFDLAMIDIGEEVPEFLRALRAERFGLPVLACGIDAPADRAVAAIRAGARDYLPLPPQRELIAAAIAAVVEQRDGTMLGADPALLRAVALAEAVSRSASPVLVVGENGSGRETMARRLHAASGRPGPLHVVECEGVAAEIVNSELFGHEPGAFPGASARRIGRLEAAGTGSVFLREVGGLAPATQVRLVAALQRGSIRRIGGDAEIAVSARLIASSGIDLAAHVERGNFRADLLARLGLARIEVPPLRDRPGDIADLAVHFATQFARADGTPRRTIGAEAEALLRGYAWPGNVRELEDLIHRAVLLSNAPVIGPDDLVRADGVPIAAGAPSGAGIGDLVGCTVEEVERALILQTLERFRGNRTAASQVLGISVRTMRNKLRTFIEAGIPVSSAS